jgi:hypothetical protein
MIRFTVRVFLFVISPVLYQGTTAQYRSTIFLSPLISSRTTHSNFLEDRCQFVCKGLSIVLIATDYHMRWDPFHNNFLFRCCCFPYYPCRHFVRPITFQCPLEHPTCRQRVSDFSLPPVRLCVALPFGSLSFPPLRWEYLRISSLSSSLSSSQYTPKPTMLSLIEPSV